MPPSSSNKRGTFRFLCLSAIVLFTFSILYINFTFVLKSTSSTIAISNLGRSTTPTSKYSPPPQPTTTTGTDRRENVHVIFSTDCSMFQSWQSYTVFASAYRVNQPGNITRIVSGCSHEEKEEMERYHNTYINPSLSENYYVHFTPSYDLTSEGKKYSFFNKPHGVNHFLQTPHLLSDTVVVVLIDPDEFFLKPIYNDFRSKSNVIISVTGENELPDYVVDGKPIAQQYGLGGKWTEWDLDFVTGVRDSPAKKYTTREASKYFAAGPPYFATASDFRKIASKWSEFAGRAYSHKPGLLAEMYAWCIAVAHLEMENVLIDSFMISNIAVNKGEGWNLIDNLESPVCSESHMDPKGDTALPTFLHLCQMNRVGEWALHKRKIPRDVFTCEASMLAVPPLNLGEYFRYKTQGMQNGKERDNAQLTEWEMKRTAFQVCAGIRIINFASEVFKDKHCAAEGGGNREKVWKQSLK